MSQWGNLDLANNAPIWAVAQVGQTVNTANRDLLFGNTSANGYGTGEVISIVGVSANEVSLPGVLSITVEDPGSGFTARPTVSINSVASGVNATATAVGIVVAANVQTAGTGYANGDVLTVAGGTGTAATLTAGTNGSGAITSVTILTAGAYTVLPTLSNNAVTDAGAGSGAGINLTIGCGAITMTERGTGYSLSAPPTAYSNNNGGTGVVLRVNMGGSGMGVAHSGWNLRKVGAGNRSNRIQFETLVALGDGVTGSDANDDALVPGE